MQRGDLRGEIGDVLLRAVDDREPLVQLLQVLDRVLGRALHRLAEAVRHRVEPLVDRALERALPAGQHVAHGLQARGRVGLQPDHLGHGGVRRRVGPLAAPEHQRKRAQRREPDHHADGGDDDDQRLVHAFAST